MGIFDGISKKIAAMRQRSTDKKEFFSSILRAAEDGKLTEEEIEQLQSQFKALGLTRNDVKGVRVQAYQAALRSAKADGVVTELEVAELAKLQHFLMIPEVEVAKSKKELMRLRLLNEIQQGNIPTISINNVILQKAEKPYWSEAGSILEERVVNRRYEGGSQGVSIRIAKGLTYRVGAHRGHLVSDTAVLPVSSGDLIITNRRVIFRGDSKSFNIRLDKLLEMKLFGDGIRLTDEKGKPRIVKFNEEGNSEIVGAILSHAINGFGAVA
ncbi:MAG TPA: hypothetical protein PLD37_04495 [Usitatibacteraceae bacterium]|nr:hypothetical protein [Usitatibacteraceae bacterium]